MARKRRLPPLAALRVFESAARNESFTAAAEELNVTQSAVSHQVKRFEQFFGKQLFLRSPRGIALTSAGRTYQRELTDLLNRLDSCTQRLAYPDQPELLQIRATPAFTTRWLLPRMHRFSARHPELDYEVTVGMPPTDLSQSDVDVYIHWDTQPVPDACVEPFFESARTPVASRDFLRAAPPLRKPSDLLGVTLLHDKVEDGWSAWFESCGVTPPAAWRGPRFAHCELAMVAAETGQGVALAYISLVERELASGQLIRLFDQETLGEVIYSLAYRESDAREPRIRAFRDWLFEEVAQSAAPPLQAATS